MDRYVEFKDKRSEDIFAKGQSKRIWGELFKVIDSADVVIQVGFRLGLGVGLGLADLVVRFGSG